MEVLYSVNGKYFKPFGIYISESKGLFDKPKPKPRRSYDWAEYHGKVVDLSPIKYDERKIELKGWIEGENWQQMVARFNLFMSEFEKEGLARLIIDYGKELVYDVYLDAHTELEKTFREGSIVGIFTLKLSEPYPLKRVYKFVNYNNDDEFTMMGTINSHATIIVNNDIYYSYYNTIDIDNAPLERNINDFYEGRNLITKMSNNVVLSNAGWRYFKLSQKLIEGETYILNGNVVDFNGISDFGLNNLGGFHATLIHLPLEEPFVATAQMAQRQYFSVANNTGSTAVQFKDFKLEKGHVATKWSNAPEDVHFITLSGDLDKITNLNISEGAEILWETL